MNLSIKEILFIFLLVQIKCSEELSTTNSTTDLTTSPSTSLTTDSLPLIPVVRWKYLSSNVETYRINQIGKYNVLNQTNSTSIPGSRQQSCIWFIDGIYYLFGGFGYGEVITNQGGQLNDFWKFDGTNWTWIGGYKILNNNGSSSAKGEVNSTNLPRSRNAGVSWVDHNKNMWLFGGFTSSNVLGDLWRFNSSSGWVLEGNISAINSVGSYGLKGIPASTNYPPSRYAASSWTDINGNLMLFGGTTQSNYLNDLWRYNISSGWWTWLSGRNASLYYGGEYGVKGVPDINNFPSGRRDAMVVVDSLFNVWLFGGEGTNHTSSVTSEKYNDLWRLDSNLIWTWMSGSSTANISGIYGEKGVSNPNNCPGSRKSTVGWVDSEDTIYIFGGEGFSSDSIGRLDDVWRYKDGKWTWIGGRDLTNGVGSYSSAKHTYSFSNYPGSRQAFNSFQYDNSTYCLFSGFGFPGEGGNILGYLQDIWCFEVLYLPHYLTSSALTTSPITTKALTTGITTGITTRITTGITTNSRVSVTSASTLAPVTTSTLSTLPSESISTTSPSESISTTSKLSTSPNTVFATTQREDINFPSESKKKSNIGAIVGGVIGSAVAVLLLCIGIYFIVNKKKKKENKRESSNQNLELQVSSTPTLNQTLNIEKDFIIPYKNLKIIKKIGSGAFGDVFKAEYNGSKVAVKKISGSEVTPDQIEDFKEEARTMKEIPPHPNVILFRGITVSPDPFCIVVEFCKKGSLHSYLKSNAQITIEDKIKFAKDIARGMVHLHTAKSDFQVIHRDLAARNILIKRGDVCAVSDFGMARIKVKVEDSSVTKQTMGPLKWMAPESIKKHQYSIKSDVFSYGVVLYEIVTRLDPWSNLTNGETIFEVLSGKRMEVPSSVNCPPVLLDIMKQCWAHEPDQRPTFSEILEIFKKYNAEEKERVFNDANNDLVQVNNQNTEHYNNTSTNTNTDNINYFNTNSN